jgi:DNA (cytosine-5)-methyltransferase 1
MKYGSVCSGIEAASVAWHPLGWTPAWFCEIGAFPSAVLAHHYPEVTNHGDFTKLIDAAHPVHADGGIDLLVGGTPCQSFSVAGLRMGLADARGNLTLEFLRLVRACAPRWVVWENVPGVLSQDEGRAFGAFLGGLADLGYGWAYRVLDAQHVRVDGYPGAVPQRRQRVFVVGCARGDFARAASVLLEPESLHGDSPPGRKPREGAAFDPSGCFDVCGTLSRGHAGGLDGQDAYTGRVLPVAFDTTQITNPHNRSNPQPGDPCHPLAASAHPPALAHGFNASCFEELSPTVKVGSGGDNGSPPGVMQAMSVRRLTPVECERLQGFPDDYTRIPWRGKPAEECPDGPRYKALGNSMACNVMRWLGRRIELVEACNAR